MTSVFRDYVAGALALVLVLTFCFLEAYAIINGKNTEPPPAMLVIVSGVIAFFFGQHATANGSAAATATAAATAAHIATTAALATTTQQLAVAQNTAAMQGVADSANALRSP